jgi:hypothetical protein
MHFLVSCRGTILRGIGKIWHYVHVEIQKMHPPLPKPCTEIARTRLIVELVWNLIPLSLPHIMV